MANSRVYPGFSKPLHLAVIADDFPELTRLLESGSYDVNGKDGDSWRARTPLWLAVWWQRKEMVKLLLRHHAKVAKRCPDYITTVMAAVCEDKPAGTRSDPEILQLLLDHGGEEIVDAVDAGGRSALVMAVGQDCVSCVRRLMSAGAEVVVHEEDGWSVMSLAELHGFTEVLNVLKEEMRKRGECMSLSLCYVE